LGIKDDQNLIITVDPAENGNQLIHIEKKIMIHFCPECNFQMYSKGTYTRYINHPILQNGVRVIFEVKQRRYRCTNPNCGKYVADTFSFFDKYKRNTNIADYLIVEAFRNFNKSARQIAREFNVSDTYALSTFARYVDMKRLPLTQAICIDEVFLNISSKHKYALIIQDFRTGVPIDMVQSRREDVTLPYFAGIPKQERMMVKYLITDMYRPYLNYIDKYFPNALPVIDSFHVIQQINHRINRYIYALQRKYRERDIRQKEDLERKLGHHIQLKESKEVYLLRAFRWLVLKNYSEINYSKRPYFDGKFNCQMYTSDYERELFNLDPNLKKLRDLKEIYVSFNDSYVGRPKAAREALEGIITKYISSEFPMFVELGLMLKDFKEPILNSFTLLERVNKDGIPHTSRLSNGPMESLNRIPKDMKRSARGYRNFDHIRNRFLFSTRRDAPILAFPKSAASVHFYTGVKRGKYHLKKNHRINRLK